MVLIYDKHLKTTRKCVKIQFSFPTWEARGNMVSALDSGASGLGSNPGWRTG